MSRRIYPINEAERRASDEEDARRVFEEIFMNMDVEKVLNGLARKARASELSLSDQSQSQAPRDFEEI